MISELVSTYLEDHNLSYRAMAEKISQQLGVPNAITYQSIMNWSTGLNTPRPTLLMLMSKHCNGSLKELADQVLKELDANLIAN